MGPSEKSVLMDKIFAFPGFSYTILLLYLLSFVETPRKFMFPQKFLLSFVFPQSLTSILYSPCKHTRNLILLLLTTENIEVGSWKKQLA